MNASSMAIVLVAVSVASCQGKPPPHANGDSGHDAGVTTSSAAVSATAPPPVDAPTYQGCGENSPAPVPVTGHPRIWITEKDLPNLRARATAGNPVYVNGIQKLAGIFDKNLAASNWPLDDNHKNNSCYRCEFEMETFALMSLLATDKATKDTWAGKARKVLMEMMAQSKRSFDKSQYNNPAAKDFAWSDRSRWAGRAFGVTVDWIYPYLSKEDKAEIREVFIKWCEQLVHAEKTSQNHPVPVGVFNDPVLVKNREAVRWSGNNYYVAHGRNLALMAMSLDPADDPDGKLRGYLDNATGAYLYVTDNLLRTDSAGGLMPEGSEYSVATMEYLAEHVYALQTAGLADVKKRGQQVSVCNNAFYRDTLTAYFHLLAPGPHPYKHDIPYYNDFVSYGDVEVFRPFDPFFGDYIATFGPLGLAFLKNGDEKYYDTARWLAVYTPPGGKDLLYRRMGDPSVPWQALWYFLLLDPARKEIADPRPSMAKDYWAPLGFQFARSSWDKDASYFFWQLEWGTIDHRHADANNFGMYRKGEWLTTERPGYELSFMYTPSHNTISIQNDPTPNAKESMPRHTNEQGSQYPYGHLTDPVLVARSTGQGFVYDEGNATAHYNSEQYKALDVVEASRALVWLEPDTVVVYDRAISKTAGRFKRYHQLLPNAATINGQVAESKTEGGQKLVINALLPKGAKIQDDPLPKDRAAAGNEMNARIVVESTATDERFLNVLQGMDGGATAAPATAFKSSSGSAYDGAVVGNTAVAFKHDSANSVADVSFAIPASVTKLVVTGLAPGAGYTVTKTPSGNAVNVKIVKGGDKAADSGGVLSL